MATDTLSHPAEFPADILDRAEREIDCYGIPGYEMALTDAYMARRSGFLDDLVAGIEAIAWRIGVPYKVRVKQLKTWQDILQHETGQRPSWSAIPDELPV